MSTVVSFDIDEYGNPLTMTGGDADALLILRGLFKTKKNPMLGDLGFNINRYKFTNIDELVRKLPNEIKDYVFRVLPNIIIDEVRCEKISRNSILLMIFVEGATGQKENVKLGIELMQNSIDKTLTLKQVKKIKES